MSNDYKELAATAVKRSLGMGIDGLIGIKSSLLLSLDSAKRRSDFTDIRAIATAAASLEARIGALLLERGDLEGAVINFISEASCRMDAQDSARAIAVLRTAEALTSLERVREWIGRQMKDYSVGSSHGERPARICILDFGVDESHPALQGQVEYQVVVDASGRRKECVTGCDSAHGTSVAGVLVGRPVSRRELGIEGDGVIRLGMAPECKLVSVAMGGEESGTMCQLVSAMDWIIGSIGNPTYGGYEVVVVGLELTRGVDSEFREGIDRCLQLMQGAGLVPILPSGNRGSQSMPLGEHGLRVGSMDNEGNASPRNGLYVDILAPGVDVLCCEPGLSPLKQSLVSLRSGSSFAAAYVGGVVASIAYRTGQPADNVAKTALANARDGRMPLCSELLVQLEGEAISAVTATVPRAEERVIAKWDLAALGMRNERVCVAA